MKTIEGIELLTFAEVAEILGITEISVRRHVREGHLSAVPIKGVKHISRDNLRAFLQGETTRKEGKK